MREQHQESKTTCANLRDFVPAKYFPGNVSINSDYPYFFHWEKRLAKMSVSA